MRPFSSITNLFSAVLPFLLLDVLDYKANASPMRNLSETATSSSASQLNGRGQPLVPRMTIGYAYWQDEAKCQEYNNEDLFSRPRTYFVLSPVPKYDAAEFANAQEWVWVSHNPASLAQISNSASPSGSCECIFEADKYQVLDSKMQYAISRRERSTITFLAQRYKIPRMILTRHNTKNLNIRLECEMHLRAVEIIEWNKWPITDWPLGDDSKNKTIDAFKSEWEARNPNHVH
ncbi:hypothetical protein F5890DRAFT_1510049 [Lentinula detonsa]|uniref:Uncharacterized protein n=1 Tax=Lentinula detonsa TaxID=2804962 RepID=A0AA38Q1A1_9AGAR|nr:hypothetical protein F5890DRAFT_1510049 [Lentinula detonsa]